MKEAWGWIRDIAIAVVIAAVLLFFFKPIIIQQESMQPNFYSKDYVIVSKQAYKLFENDPVVNYGIVAGNRVNQILVKIG